MTGGRVVVLGKTGRNFAAGMSGGIAYVLDRDGDFHIHCNQEQCDLERLEDPVEISEVKGMIQKHAEYTGSTPALENFSGLGENGNAIRQGRAARLQTGP